MQDQGPQGRKQTRWPISLGLFQFLDCGPGAVLSTADSGVRQLFGLSSTCGARNQGEGRVQFGNSQASNSIQIETPNRLVQRSELKNYPISFRAGRCSHCSARLEVPCGLLLLQRSQIGSHRPHWVTQKYLLL